MSGSSQMADLLGMLVAEREDADRLKAYLTPSGFTYEDLPE